MSDFKAKMHKIDFRWGAPPDPSLPRPLVVLKGHTSKGRAGEQGGEGEGKGNGRGGGVRG